MNDQERFRSLATWKTPEQARLERRRESNNGRIGLAVVGSGIVAGVIAAATGDLSVFWMAWITLGVISSSMVLR